MQQAVSTTVQQTTATLAPVAPNTPIIESFRVPAYQPTLPLRTPPSRERVRRAISMVNDALGMRDLPTKAERYTLSKLTSERPGKQPREYTPADETPDIYFNAMEQFWRDVDKIVAMLESNGTWHHKKGRTFLESPFVISHQMIDDGYIYATYEKVLEAQQLCPDYAAWREEKRQAAQQRRRRRVG